MPRRQGDLNADFKHIPPLPKHFKTHALCQNAPINWFYPPKGTPPIGKKLCHICPLQPECLTYAINNQINHGLWGGMTERERFTERAKRRRQSTNSYDTRNNGHPASRSEHSERRGLQPAPDER